MTLVDPIFLACCTMFFGVLRCGYSIYWQLTWRQSTEFQLMLKSFKEKKILLNQSFLWSQVRRERNEINPVDSPELERPWFPSINKRNRKGRKKFSCPLCHHVEVKEHKTLFTLHNHSSLLFEKIWRIKWEMKIHLFSAITSTEERSLHWFHATHRQLKYSERSSHYLIIVVQIKRQHHWVKFYSMLAKAHNC